MFLNHARDFGSPKTEPNGGTEALGFDLVGESFCAARELHGIERINAVIDEIDHGAGSGDDLFLVTVIELDKFHIREILADDRDLPHHIGLGDVGEEIVVPTAPNALVGERVEFEPLIDAIGFELLLVFDRCFLRVVRLAEAEEEALAANGFAGGDEEALREARVLVDFEEPFALVVESAKAEQQVEFLLGERGTEKPERLFCSANEQSRKHGVFGPAKLGRRIGEGSGKLVNICRSGSEVIRAVVLG